MDTEHHVMSALGLLMDEARQLLVDREDGLRPSQFRVIDNVPTDEVITITELAERVGMTKQGIGQFVTQLCRDGYLATSSDPADGRMRLVRRTPLGESAIERLVQLLDGLEGEWAARVGAQRYREFRSLLDEIAGIG